MNAKDKSGCTALHKAAYLGSPAIIRELRAKGANLDARNDRGKTALDYAIRFKKAENILALQK